MMKTTIKCLYTALLAATPLLVSLPALAQSGPDNGGPTGPPPAAVPIDGGVGLLLAAGGVYAVKKARGARKAGGNKN